MLHREGGLALQEHVGGLQTQALLYAKQCLSDTARTELWAAKPAQAAQPAQPSPPFDKCLLNRTIGAAYKSALHGVAMPHTHLW